MRTLRAEGVIVSMSYFVLARFFFSRRFFMLASFFRNSSLETLKIVRTALSSRCHGVFPGTSGAGDGFIITPILE